MTPGVGESPLSFRSSRVLSLCRHPRHADDLGGRLPFFGVFSASDEAAAAATAPAATAAASAAATATGSSVPRRELAMAAVLRQRMSKGLNTVVSGRGWGSLEGDRDLLGWRGAVAAHLVSLAAEEDLWGPYLIVVPTSRCVAFRLLVLPPPPPPFFSLSIRL